MSSEKALSSENLLLQSQDFDTTWDSVGLSSRSGGNADPAGGTTAHRFIEDSSSATHRVYQTVSSAGKTSLTVYAKQAVGTRYLALKVSTGSGGPYDWVVATYDLAGGTPAMTTGTGATSIAKSSAQTLSGGGFYKCTLTVESSGGGVNVSMTSVTTPSPANYGHIGYTGDGASAIDVAFSSLNSTGATDYNATTTQIHREFAPTLKTASADAPRFEYDPITGNAEGLLVQSQATNSYPNSSDMTGTAGARTNIDSNVAVGPTGGLTADAVRLDSTNSNDHYKDYSYTAAASTVYTFSVYVKAAGLSYICIRPKVNFTATPYIFFNLSTGAVTGGDGVAESVGNGWYRCSVKATSSGATTSTFRLYVTDNGSTTTVATGDSYRAVLGTGLQVEASSAPSSLISTSGASATRAADVCTLVSEPLLDNGSGALVTEYDMQSAGETSFVLHAERSVGATNSGGVSVTNKYLTVNGTYEDIGSTSSNVFHKVAASWENGSQKISRDGGAVAEDTATVIPSGVDTLHIGTRQDGGESVNGHIKSIAIYSEPLTSTNLTTLSQ